MDTQEIIKQLRRYSGLVDVLLEAELKNLYGSSSEKERIQVTKIFNEQRNNLHMPDEWARLIIEKGTDNEKIALARYGQSLNVRYVNPADEERWINRMVKEAVEGRLFEGLGEDKPETIQSRLLENSNILIKLALYENTDFLSGR